ncbi:caspase, EACC1-associated type [Nocardia sp. alder85J]|uniref:caspase, EACC1-associated type n=1 Tax=Nocardia sp. alder85J TaxID=2862949 RepID=UPI001CD3A666|nr:tetratricopeptide repeat protein [Nocardia sp. alder85J]MCX4097658.1 tetratricopeptide repeat protein [Nocardia sp. alder85J]
MTVDPENSRAVLIGAAQYDDENLAPIPAAAANVADLAELLTAPGGAFTAAHCRRVTEPDRVSVIGDTVAHAARAASGVLLVYYTGHGLIDRRGRLHLAVTGSDPDRISWTAVPFQTLREEILDSPARARILILDCCFAGRAFEAMADLPSVIAGQTDLHGTYTITSSSRDEPSFAPGGHRNTAFTGALLAAATPETTLDDLFRQADLNLRRNGHPRPHRRSVDITGDIRLFGQIPNEQTHRRAAENGSADAMHDLARLLRSEGRITEAAHWWRHAAGTGHPDAMNQLATLLRAQGQTQEIEKWWHQAATAGHPDAANNLAILLRARGEADEAEQWWRQAAAGDHPDAMNSLGTLLHAQGEPDEAEHWWRRAATAGHPDAANSLAILLHAHGEPEEAEQWWRRAAATGHPDAMNNLGLLMRGRQQTPEAERWWRQAATSGHPDATRNLAILGHEQNEPGNPHHRRSPQPTWVYPPARESTTAHPLPRWSELSPRRQWTHLPASDDPPPYPQPPPWQSPPPWHGPPFPGHDSKPWDQPPDDEESSPAPGRP